MEFLNANYTLILSHVNEWYLDCGFGNWRNTKREAPCPLFEAWYKMYNYQPWNTLLINSDDRKRVRFYFWSSFLWNINHRKNFNNPF